MTQLALVAFYGEKPPGLARLIADCQAQLARALGAAFLPYAVEQIHATLVGMEQTAGAPGENANFAQHRQQRRRMDFAGLLDFVRTTVTLPMTVQIGGFADRVYGFTSRGRTPYARSFTQQSDKAVLMGWPVDLASKGRTIYPTQLDELRRAVQSFNILHKYHAAPEEVDNDFYFRIGLLEMSKVSAARLQTAAADLRHYLSIRQPLLLPLGREQLSIVAYEDERLPPSTTRRWSLDDPTLSATMLSGLYTHD
jgi:hypothetical protein